MAAWQAKRAAAAQISAEEEARERGKSERTRGMFGDDGAPIGMAPALMRTEADVQHEIARKHADAALRADAAIAAADDDDDPLDAFMATEVLPEVQARQQEVRSFVWFVTGFVWLVTVRPLSFPVGNLGKFRFPQTGQRFMSSDASTQHPHDLV